MYHPPSYIELCAQEAAALPSELMRSIILARAIYTQKALVLPISHHGKKERKVSEVLALLVRVVGLFTMEASAPPTDLQLAQ